VGEKKRGKRRAQLTASFSIEHLQLSWFEGGLRYVIDLPQYTVNVYEFSEKTQAVSSLGESHGGGSDGGRSRLWQKDYDHIQDIKDSQEANDRPAAQEAPTSSEKQEKFRWLDADAAEEFGSPTSEQVRETPKTSTTTTREYFFQFIMPSVPNGGAFATQQIILPLTFDSIQEDEADEINTSLSDLVGPSTSSDESSETSSSPETPPSTKEQPTPQSESDAASSSPDRPMSGRAETAPSARRRLLKAEKKLLSPRHEYRQRAVDLAQNVDTR